MDPALLSYMRQMSGVDQQANQQAAQQNPLKSGTESGIHAAKESLAMDENDRARAQGDFIMQLGAHMARPGYGNGIKGTLAALNAGMIPAQQAYRSEEERVMQRNAFLQEQAQ